MLFVYMGNLLVRAYFDVTSNLVVKLLIRTLFIDSFVKRIIRMERCIFPSRSQKIAIISEYRSLSELLAQVQNSSDAETITYDQQDNIERTPQVKFAKCVAISPKS